jgi:hypothetical protein
MPNLKLGGITALSESGGVVTLPAEVIGGTGLTTTSVNAANIASGILPIGVTGGSGLDALSASNLSAGTVSLARLGTGGTKLLWRNSTGVSLATHSTTLIFGCNQILGTVPTTTNYLLMEVSVRYRVEFNCAGVNILICLNNTGSSHATYNAAEVINPTNFTSLDDTNGAAGYLMNNIKPTGVAYTASVHHFNATFMFDGSSQFHASTNYAYLGVKNLTGGGAYTRSDCYMNSVTMWEIQK